MLNRVPISFFLVFLLALLLQKPADKTRIYLIGDSTMCYYEPTRSPLTGWGMPFANFFDSTVVIDNRARGGRSTRTFLSEGRWQPIADSLNEGDYVLIQFGHNDEAKEEKYKDRYTPVPDYKTNLIKFITEARTKKAIPVLITPVSRMRFDKEGIQKKTHKEYSAAVMEVGAQYQVPVLDLDKRSRELFQQLGPERTKLLFMQLDSVEHPNYPGGQKDNTHFNDYGARRIAELVLSEIKEKVPALSSKIVIAASKAGITRSRDTSFNIQSEFIKNSKKYPSIKIVAETHSDSVVEEKNIVYGRGDEKKLLLDAFYPAYKSSRKRTAIIFLFGGGWRSGDRSLHYPLAERLAAKGYVCFTPDYRVSTEALYPAAIYDVKAAIRWVRKNAGKYGIDKIVIGGHSAGGELAAFMGSTNGDKNFEGDSGNEGYSSKVDAVIDIDGTLAFIHPESGEGDDSKKISAATYWFGYSKTQNPGIWNQASPLTHAGPGSAPILFLNSSIPRMHAGRDDYIKILDQYHIYSRVRTFEDTPHSFLFFEPWFERVITEIDDFLKTVIK
jgi:acetyl esterase/lipase/lysophospholipase L1-like esterase